MRIVDRSGVLAEVVLLFVLVGLWSTVALLVVGLLVAEGRRTARDRADHRT